MRHYVFITMSACQIGGAEQYIYNKCLFLERLGFRVHVISGLKRPFMIHGLKCFEKECIPCVMYAPSSFSKINRRKLLNVMKRLIAPTDTDSILIESNGIAQALWGELLASDLKCKHVYFDLYELYDFNTQQKDYIRYKCCRNEIAGITRTSIGQMLEEPETEYTEAISACCNNVVADCKDEYLNNISNDIDYIIGYMGRLEKKCLPNVLKEFQKFAVRYNSKKIVFVFIGGANNKRITENIKKELMNYANVEVVITGYVYPISRSLIKKVNIFVSTAGSAIVSYYDHIPTIMVHPVEGYSIGIIGESFAVGDNMYIAKDKRTVSENLSRIINAETTIEFDDTRLLNYEKRMHDEFQRQLLFAEKCRIDTDFQAEKVIFSGKKNRVYYFVGKFFGSELLFRLSELFRMVIGTK